MRLLIFLSLPLLGLFSCQSRQSVDLLVRNGHIYTMESEGASVEAMVIDQGRILALGTEADLIDRFDADSTIDLKGKTVLPGFIDAHCHFPAYARSLLTADLRGARSESEMVRLLKSWYDEQMERGREMRRIDGWGWDQNDWPEREMPTRASLDSVFPDIPVVLRRVDGHAVLVNTSALEEYEVSGQEVAGGEIVLKSGSPTGLLIDNAADLIAPARLDSALMHSALLQAEKNCFQKGLTGLNDAGLGPDEWQPLRRMLARRELQMPIYCMAADDSSNYHFLNVHGPVSDDRFWLESVKFYADGALGSRGALLLEPYHDAHDHFGLPVRTADYLQTHYKRMRELGLQVCTHAIGDSANRIVLQLYGEVISELEDHRWRIEHAQVVAEEDWPLFREYQVLPSVQPTHATSDADWAEDRLGESRMVRAYAYSSLEEQLGLIPLGTDFPIEDIDPLKTFYAAVARKDFTGEPKTGFRKEEALSRWKALKGMTYDAAFAQFREDEVGRLVPGSWANWVLWDNDLLNCHEDSIPFAQVQMTVLRGEKVYENNNPR